jgi:hypothetical protein
LKLFHRLSWRPAQVEYLLTRFRETTTNREAKNNLRVSTGVVFRFTSGMGCLEFPAANFKQQSELTCH